MGWGVPVGFSLKIREFEALWLSRRQADCISAQFSSLSRDAGGLFLKPGGTEALWRNGAEESLFRTKQDFTLRSASKFFISFILP